jgi:DNA-binding beta-propeller fold protein YncE
VLLCPTRLPGASVGHPAHPPEPITAQVIEDKGDFYGIEYGYGAPSERRFRGRNTPTRFLHFALLQGHSWVATPPRGSRYLGEARFDGRKGRLYRALGGYHADHFIFTWREGGVPFTASLHSWERRPTLRLLGALLAGLEPAETLPPQPVPRLPTGTRRVRAGEQASDLAVGEERLWVMRYLPGGLVVGIDRRTRKPIGVPTRVGRYPYQGIAASHGSVWVANTARRSVSRIDATTGEVVGPVIPVGKWPWAIAFGELYVWVANYRDGTLSRIDPASNRVVGGPVMVGGGPNGLATAGGSVWVTDFDRGRVVRVDEWTGNVVSAIETGGGLSSVAAGRGAIWVTDFRHDVLLRIDPTSNRIVAKIPVGPAPSDVAVQQESVWVTDYWDGTVRRFNTRTNRSIERLTLGGRLSRVAAGKGEVWVLDSPYVIRVPVETTNSVDQPLSRWPVGLVMVGILIAVTVLAKVSMRGRLRTGAH